MKKISTAATRRNKIFNEAKLNIGPDLGDRTSHYCILDEAGNVILEHSLPTTAKGIQQVFRRIPRSRIALETGTHSRWVSRQLSQLGHEVIVAHARNMRLNGGAELNRRVQVTATNSWPNSRRREGSRGRLSGSSTC